MTVRRLTATEAWRQWRFMPDQVLPLAPRNDTRVPAVAVLIPCHDEAAAERAIAGEHVGDARAEDHADQAGQHAIAETVAAAISGLAAHAAHRRHHVELPVDQHLDQRRCSVGVVGVVAVHQHVDVGLDVREHPPHDMALALRGLMSDARAGCSCDCDGVVARIVVVDINCRLGQRLPEILNHFVDGGFLIITGDKNGNVRHCCFGFRRRSVIVWQALPAISRKKL